MATSDSRVSVAGSIRSVEEPKMILNHILVPMPVVGVRYLDAVTEYLRDMMERELFRKQCCC